jgi:hypothetical protein
MRRIYRFHVYGFVEVPCYLEQPNIDGLVKEQSNVAQVTVKDIRSMKPERAHFSSTRNCRFLPAILHVTGTQHDK